MSSPATGQGPAGTVPPPPRADEAADQAAPSGGGVHDATVAYIVVCWNNLSLIDECLESIAAQTHPHTRVLLIDNDSADGTVEHVREHHPDVEVLPQDDNLGFAKGNNVGIAHVLADPDVAHVVLVNSDARLDPGWTTAVLDMVARKPRGAAFQGLTLDYADHSIIDTTHIFVARNGQATQGSFRRVMPDGVDVAPQRVFGCNAAAVLYTRAFIEAQPFEQFFDEDMFMYLEDVDVAARATVMGWECYVVPGARALHMGSASSASQPSWSLYMTFRNNSGMLAKNLPAPLLRRMLPKILLADVSTVVHLARTGRRDRIGAVVRGRVVGLWRLGIFWRKRKALQPQVRDDVESLWSLMERGF